MRSLLWKMGAAGITEAAGFAGRRVLLLGALAAVIACVWARPAAALPSFAAQTGAPCVACHIGGFGPQLTPFGISFRENGYTFSGGTGPWAHIPVNLVVSPSYQTQAAAQPSADSGVRLTGGYDQHRGLLLHLLRHMGLTGGVSRASRQAG